MSADSISNADLPVLDQIQAHLARRTAEATPPAQPVAPAPPARPPLSLVTNPPAPEHDEPTNPPVDPAADPAAAEDVEPAPEDTIRDLPSLAETLGVEPEAVLEAVMVPNALGIEVPLGEAIETWRRNEETFDARRQELESTYQARIQAAQEQTQQEVARLSGLAKLLIEEMAADHQGVDWEALKHSDPQNYVRLAEMRMRRRQRIEEVFHSVEASGATRTARSTEALKAAQREEAVKLIRKMPGWVQKPETMATIVRENQEAMRHLGFSEAEIAGVTDHRMIIGLHYAAQHLKTLKGVQGKTVADAKKKHLLRPAALRQGSRQPAGAPNANVRQERMQQFSQARDVKSAAALIETMLPPQR